MKHKLYNTVLMALGLISTVMAQPDLPDAPDQGPITGIGWLLAVGGLMFANTYRRTNSLFLVSLEHALYGNTLFFIGLGWFFWGGASM